MTEEKQFQLNLKTAAASIGIFFIILLAVTFIYLTRNILALVFISYLVSLGMAGPVHFLQKHTHWKKGICAGISYIIFITLIIAGFSLLIPPLVQQITDLIKKFDLAIAVNQLNQIGISITSFDSLVKQIGSLSKPVFSSLASIASQTFQAFTMIILSFHFVMDQGRTKHRIKSITNNEHIATSLQSFSDLLKVNLGGWIRGELALMLIIGLVSFIAFSLIGIPYALPLAVLAALLELIPNLGPIIAAIPAIALAFSVDPVKGVIALIVCIIIQQAENIFIVPRIMKTAAGVNPMISIVAILVGFQLLGVAGALLALPTYIFLRSSAIFFIRDKKFHLN